MESLTVSSIETELEFVRFLLVCTKQQGVLLLKHLSPAQVNSISEICHNLLYSDLDESLLADLKHRKALIRRLGDKQRGVNSRRKDIAKHSAAVLSLLREVEPILPESVHDV